ncbi:MAG: PKD domain-containing protein [bacterium]
MIADPIATIKVTPTDGTTSSTYAFDASTSYSVQSTLSSYSWSITDADGNEITKQKVKTFQQKFAKPGTYRVMLKVVDQLGNTNEDAVTLQV